MKQALEGERDRSSCTRYEREQRANESLLVMMGHGLFLAPAVTVGETKGAMDSTSVFFWPLLLPITL